MLWNAHALVRIFGLHRVKITCPADLAGLSIDATEASLQLLDAASRSRCLAVSRVRRDKDILIGQYRARRTSTGKPSHPAQILYFAPLRWDRAILADAGSVGASKTSRHRLTLTEDGATKERQRVNANQQIYAKSRSSNISIATIKIMIAKQNK